MNAKRKNAPPARKTFRHGDLYRALLDAGVDLAREGGPGAVILREATRRAGVAPNAAYRHFSNHADLLQAVRATSLSSLAVAIETEIAACRHNKCPADYARAALHAVGTGYIKFALKETGLFRTAFSVPVQVEGEPDDTHTGESGLNPFQLLGSALDLMVNSGVLPPDRRPGAEFLAWSAVHGFAFLVIEGPLGAARPKEITALADRLLAMVEKGI